MSSEGLAFEPICREHGGAHVLDGLCLLCENAKLRSVFDLLKSNTKELQSDCIHMSNELSEKKLQNAELKKVLLALVTKVHEVNKGTEYLFVFAQNHAMGQYRGPQYGEALREAERLTGYTEKLVVPAPKEEPRKIEHCGVLRCNLSDGCQCSCAACLAIMNF